MAQNTRENWQFSLFLMPTGVFLWPPFVRGSGEKPVSIFASVPPCLLCAFLSGCFQDFLFLIGFKQLDEEVPWCGFLCVPLLVVHRISVFIHQFCKIFCHYIFQIFFPASPALLQGHWKLPPQLPDAP